MAWALMIFSAAWLLALLGWFSRARKGLFFLW
jgi:hypothetical protein